MKERQAEMTMEKGDEIAAKGLQRIPREAFGRNKEEEDQSPEELKLEGLCRTRMKFILANTLDVFRQQAVPAVIQHLNKNQNGTDDSILFVEVHGMDNYQAFELEPYLQYWRELSKNKGVPFFAFTILREALSLQVSFFNYYYIHPGDPRFCRNPLKPQQRCGSTNKAKQEWESMQRAGRMGGHLSKMRESFGRGMGRRFRDRNKVTHENGMEDMTHDELEKVMLKVAYDNPQCLFLARGERSYGDDPDEVAQRQGLRRNECQNAYLSLQRTMDWIGRTDTISSETLPLLTDLMFKQPHLGLHLPKANVSPHKGGWVKLSTAAESTKNGLERLSQLDQEIYHRVKEDYTMDQWVNHEGIVQEA